MFGLGGLGSLFGGIGKSALQGISNLGSGIGNFFTGGQGNKALGGFNIPNMFNKGMGGISKVGSGISGLFGGSGPVGNPGGGPPPIFGSNQGGSINQWLGQSHIPPALGSSIGNITSNDPTSGGGMWSKLFKNPYIDNPVTKGLAGVGLSQMVPNPKMPGLPQGYDQMYQQAMAGGTPASQAAQRYLQQIMSGENQGAYDAATQAVDQAYEEQVRQLDSMYKSLRPGTDLASDSAYRRDRQALDDQYAQRKAMVMAQVQQGAVGSAMQSGQNQMANMALALQPQFEQQNQQWLADYQKRAMLRNQLMGIGASYAYPQSGYGALSQLFERAGNTNPTY